MKDVKQVIIVRKDLNMRRGKSEAQVAHASMKVILDKFQREDKHIIISYSYNTWCDSPMEQWINGLFKKIVLSCDSEEELMSLYTQAKERGLDCALIEDSGLTEFNGVPTKTCIAIGPDFSEKIDEITKHLKLR